MLPLIQLRFGPVLTVLSFLPLLGCLSTSSTDPAITVSKTEKSEVSWSRVTDFAGDFSVLMPTRPQESTSMQPSTEGPPVEMHQFLSDPDPSREFTVIYSDLPRSIENTQALGSTAFLDALQDAGLKVLGKGRLIYSKDNQFASYPMRETLFEAQEKQATCHWRIIMSGRRMYQLIFVYSTELDAAQDADTFFKSFLLLH